jgi:hypothetical protein
MAMLSLVNWQRDLPLALEVAGPAVIQVEP